MGKKRDSKEHYINNDSCYYILLIFMVWNTLCKRSIVIGIIDNIITIIDKQRDHAWLSKGDDFNVDDEVKLIVNTMYIDSNIFDDEIEDVKIINK